MADKYANDAGTWLTYAQITYEGARELFHPQKPGLWFSAAILGHQALEMLLKAALIRKGHIIDKSDVWGHDLKKLAEQLASHCGLPPELIADLDIFTDFFNELRYPKTLEKVGGLGEEEAELLNLLFHMLLPYGKGEK